MKQVEYVRVLCTRLLKRGDGIVEPERVIAQYWDDDGNLIGEVDPLVISDNKAVAHALQSWRPAENHSWTPQPPMAAEVDRQRRAEAAASTKLDLPDGTSSNHPPPSVATAPPGSPKITESGEIVTAGGVKIPPSEPQVKIDKHQAMREIGLSEME